MSKRNSLTTTNASAASRGGADPLLADLRRLIEQARQAAAAAVNAGLTRLYWRIGQRIRIDMLGGRRAGYGEEIVVSLSRQLAGDYGRGSRKRTCGAWCSSPRCSLPRTSSCR